MMSDTRELLNGLKTIPHEFSRKGGETPFKFRQIEKTDSGYIYEVDDEGVLHYEVFERRSGENYTRDAIVEYYPTTKAFGIWAWCCRDLKKAQKRLRELTVKTL